jgi:hypothetical protein
MTWIVVEADIVGFNTSVQFTTVPFKSMLTELMDNVEVRGEAPGAEVIMKVNVVKFTLIFLGI